MSFSIFFPLIYIINCFDSSHFPALLPRLFLHSLNNCMSAFFILIGFSILVAGSFLAAFLFSVKNGQYDDDYTPSIRILFDDKPETKKIAPPKK